MTETTLVSILIPVRNEVKYIERCLHSVLSQNYSQNKIEILIADGLSTDGTREILSQIKAENENVHLYDNPKKIVPTGMNILLQHAKGQVLIRVDGHCMIENDYVSRCVEHLKRDGVDGVGGPMQSIGEDFLSESVSIAMSSKFGVGNSSFRTEKGKTKLVDTVPFPAYTKEIINKIGLYDEELVRNQDDEYNYRLRKQGGRLLLADDVRSTYFTRSTLKGLWRQFLQYGFWKVRVFQKHPSQMSARQFMPAILIVGLIISLTFSLIFDWGWWLIVGISSIYLLAVGFFSLINTHKGGLRRWVNLCASYMIMHIGYGIGFLKGLFFFINRWTDKKGKVPD